MDLIECMFDVFGGVIGVVVFVELVVDREFRGDVCDWIVGCF